MKDTHDYRIIKSCAVSDDIHTLVPNIPDILNLMGRWLLRLTRESLRSTRKYFGES